MLLSILTILEFPDKRLRTKAKSVTVFEQPLKTLIADMLETMYYAQGIGLAATQVNIHQRIIVMDVSENKDTPLCFVNPVIIQKTGTTQSQEGCLSVPGFFEPIDRAEQITVQALDKKGVSFEIKATEFLAVCIQHEIDHLEGKLFVDYLSPLKRQRIKTKLHKIHKQHAKK